jgi:NAD(P)H-hydrate epimerase
MSSSAENLLPILDATAMREADRRAIEEGGIPGRVLMEAAGRAVADVAEDRFGPADGASVVVLCGTGNNGGDGYVAARLLHARGARVRVVSAGRPATADARTNRAAVEAAADDRLTVHPTDDGRLSRLRPTLVIDALLGTGQAPGNAASDQWLKDPVRGFCAWANRQRAPVLAVDIPTGLDATTGRADRDAIRAKATVTLAALKAGLLLDSGPELAGDATVVDIGIPPDYTLEGSIAWRATDRWVASRLPPRPLNAHKYSVGRVLAIAGSRPYTGAAALSTGAAYRAGAGAVVCCTPRSAQATIDALRPEVMVDPQFETDEGTLAIAAYDDVLERLGEADAVLMGCGLGRPPETQRLVRALLRRSFAPTVLDADGLNAFEGHTDKFAEAHAPLVLTPHAGELERLLGEPPAGDRLALVRELAARWNVVILLKGMPSIVGAPDGRVFIGPAPATALATAGTGDVLAGTIAGLLARGMEPTEAVVAALHIGTAAAERFEATRGPGMVAGDLLDEMPFVLREHFATA